MRDRRWERKGGRETERLQEQEDREKEREGQVSGLESLAFSSSRAAQEPSS